MCRTFYYNIKILTVTNSKGIMIIYLLATVNIQ